MKVVLISQNCNPGFLIFRRDLIVYLVSRGYDVYCFAYDYSPKTREAIEGLGAVPVDYQLSKSGLNPFRDIRDAIALTKKIRAIHPDSVFSFFVKPSIYGTLAARLAGVPRRVAMLEGLGYIHTSDETGFSFKKLLLRIVHGWLSTIGYAFADKLLFLNPDDARDLSRVAVLDKKKIQVLGPIGLDLSSYSYVPVNVQKAVRFIFVARLIAEKGVFEFLAAARSVKLTYPDAEFVVLGGLDPDNPSALSQKQLDILIADGVVIYPGHVSNVSNWIKDSHVFVLPSYREGMPRSTQEAMAIGRAVITTDVPGCRETVMDGINGFLVPPWDSYALSRKMVYFIENQDEILRMGYESHRIAIERFDVHKINNDLEKIIIGNLV